MILSNFYKKYHKKFAVTKKERIFAIQIVGFSHLLINLTNLTSGVRKFPRLLDTTLFVPMQSRIERGCPTLR